jgi:hypothetical protein
MEVGTNESRFGAHFDSFAMAVSLRPTVTAASRRSAAARLPERRVREDRSLPPEILLLGARHNHDVKCLALGQAARLVPHRRRASVQAPGPARVSE